MNSTTTTPMPLNQPLHETVSIPESGLSMHPLPLPEMPGRRSRSPAAKALAVLLAVLAAGAVGTVSLYAYIAWLLARPDISPLVSDPLHAVDLAYEDIVFLSEDGHMLEGWYIPAGEPAARTIVFSHGYGGNREEIWVPIYDLARFAHDSGYNSLMFDYGYVNSTERVVTGGAKESLDLLGAVRYARERGAEQVVVWGFSMGAGTALQAALSGGEIDAMILDSTFVLEPDTLYYNLKQYADLPREPSLTMLRVMYPLINGAAIRDVPYRKIKETAYGMPIFMIHGTLDERSPYTIIRDVAMKQTETNELSEWWLVPDATHELVYRKDPQEYKTRAAAFLARVASAASLPAGPGR